MSEQQAPAPPTFIESMEEIMKRHISEVDDEARKDRAAFDCIKEGRAWIETYEQANSAAKLLVEAETKLKNKIAVADAAVARAAARLKRLEYIFHTPLKEWTQQQLTGKKKRSMILDDAMLALRMVKEHAVTESEETLRAWAERDCVDAITYKPVVSIEKVKEWEKKSGKLAPGRRMQPDEEHFKVKIPKASEEEIDNGKV